MGIEAKFGVKIRAIQDNMTIIGDPGKVFGPNGALESLLALRLRRLASSQRDPSFNASERRMPP
jgi:hypothetical protein